MRPLCRSAPASGPFPLPSTAGQRARSPSVTACAYSVCSWLPPAACTNAYHCAAASRLEPSRQAARPHDPVRSDSEGVEVADPITMPGFAGYRPAKSSHRPDSAVGGTAPSPGPGRVDNCRKNLRPAKNASAGVSTAATAAASASGGGGDLGSGEQDRASNLD